MTTKDIGAIGENAAVKILKKSRYKILARNIHISHNELDIVSSLEAVQDYLQDNNQIFSAEI